MISPGHPGDPCCERARPRVPSGGTGGREPSGIEAPQGRTLAGSTVAAPEREDLRHLPLHLVHPRPDQPRQRIDLRALDELTDSVRSHGVLQPIRVRTRQDGYEIIAGERRWRAARRAGLHDIPAIVVDTDDDQAYVEALIENIQREELNAVDRGQALTRLRVTLGLRSWQEVGELVGITRQHVHNLLKVTRLPEPMREDLRAGGLTEKHARALLRLQGCPDEQSRLWERIHAEKLSGRAAERVSRSLGTGQSTAAPAVEPPQVELRAVVDEVLASLVVAGPEEIRAARARLVDLQRRIAGLLEQHAPAAASASSGSPPAATSAG